MGVREAARVHLLRESTLLRSALVLELIAADLSVLSRVDVDLQRDPEALILELCANAQLLAHF